MLGQIPVDRMNPSSVFRNVGVDYAGPMLIKFGSIRKLVITKAYVCVFVCFSVKAVDCKTRIGLTKCPIAKIVPLHHQDANC